MARLASAHRPPPPASRVAAAFSAAVGSVPTAVLRNMSAVQILLALEEPVAPPATKPFMALLMEPLATSVQARFQRCSSVWVCSFFPQATPKLSSVLQSNHSANELVPVSSFPQLQPPFELFVSITSAVLPISPVRNWLGPQTSPFLFFFCSTTVCFNTTSAFHECRSNNQRMMNLLPPEELPTVTFLIPLFSSPPPTAMRCLPAHE